MHLLFLFHSFDFLYPFFGLKMILDDIKNAFPI